MEINNNNKKIIEEIIEGIAEFKVIPFFGSGMSANFGIKTWGELINELRQELKTDTQDYLDVAQEYEDKFGREKLIQKIFTETGKTEFLDKDLRLHYQILAMNPPIIYTTNWDNAIEVASKNISRKYKKISSLIDITETPHYSNVIVKFHGDFSNPENIVFTRNDYQKRLEIQHPFDILFRAHLLGKKVLFMGYSFSDENIDFIFNKHKELYGTELLPQSYIISFKERFNLDRSKELAKKNIETIVLDSKDQLENFINQLNESVFSKDINKQSKSFFKSRPLQVVLKTDLQHLKNYLLDPNNTEKKKSDKFRSTLELKEMSSEVEKEVSEILVDLIGSEITLELRQAILFSFRHIQFKELKNIINVCVELMSWTKYEEFNYNLESFSMTDVMSIIESRLEEKLTCLVIFLYLVKCNEENKNLSEKELRRIFEKLRDCECEKIDDFSEILTIEDRAQLLNIYITKFPNLKRVLEQKSMFGKRTTISQIRKQMENMLGINFINLMDEDV